MMKLRRAGTALFFSIALVSCSSSPPTFYALSSPADLADPASGAKRSSDISIGVGPVVLPKELDRPQIVTRAGPHRVNLSELHNWAGALQENSLRVLAKNLGILLSTDRVLVFPWRRSIPIDYQISVEFLRFDGTLGDRAYLEARWSVFDGKSQKLLFVRSTRINKPLLADDYETLVSQMSVLLADLSREIAVGVRALRPV